MRNQAYVAVLVSVALGGCDVLFPEDPRLGTEEPRACLERVRASVEGRTLNMLDTLEGEWVPTYTYDITKVELSAMKALAVKGSDETAGARLMRSTNEVETAVQQFLAMPVNEKGAFFLGRDPALYRVRGKAQATQTMIVDGCARQQAGMRLLTVDWARKTPTPETDTQSDTTDTQTPKEAQN